MLLDRGYADVPVNRPFPHAELLAQIQKDVDDNWA